MKIKAKKQNKNKNKKTNKKTPYKTCFFAYKIKNQWFYEQANCMSI